MTKHSFCAMLASSQPDFRVGPSYVRTASDLGYVAVGYEREPYGLDRDIYIVKLEADEAGVRIRYGIGGVAEVRLAVYVVTGRHVATIVDGLKRQVHTVSPGT